MNSVWICQSDFGTTVNCKYIAEDKSYLLHSVLFFLNMGHTVFSHGLAHFNEIVSKTNFEFKWKSNFNKCVWSSQVSKGLIWVLRDLFTTSLESGSVIAVIKYSQMYTFCCKITSQQSGLAPRSNPGVNEL